VDCAKLADLVLLLVDGDFGFEMETFEFLNVLQVCLGRRADAPRQPLLCGRSPAGAVPRCTASQR